ncbi:MAG: hypothetical protein ABIR34_11650, partial [Marmoricola sp.]
CVDPRCYKKRSVRFPMNFCGVLDSVGAPDRAWAAATKGEAKAAGVSTTPSVRVDGRLMTATSPVALADDLQRLILKDSASS